MISLFRNFFQSKIGLPIFIGFLVLVGFAFAMADVTGTATFGGLTGDDKVAVVGGEDLTSNELTSAINNGLDRERQQNPTLTMPQLVADGGLERELDLMIDRMAIGQFAKKYGLRAGDNLVNSEILQISAFRNVTGDFDQATYEAALRRQGITDAILREDIASGLLAQMVLRPAFAAPQLPRAAAKQYASLVLERRRGEIALIPSSEFAPDDAPSDAQLTEFYSANRSDFIQPERRTIRFARFGADTVESDFTPTEAQIAQRFERDKAQYGAQERRAVTTFVVPTEDAAKALVERIRGGTSLVAAAREAGFNVSSGELLDREGMSSETSFALMEKVFEAERGAVVDPARSTLGWYVARVDEIERTPARTLAQVRGEITQALQQEALAGRLIDLSAQIEELVDSGTSLADVARQFDLEVTTVPQVTADGRLFENPEQGLTQGLRPILDTAFQMDESEPQLAEIVPGEQFLVFDVAEIVDSAAPPLAEVREEVAAAWARAEGSKTAREVADRILAKVRTGMPMTQALREEEVVQARVQPINISRRELIASAQQQQQGLPPPVVLLFSMAEGSTKLLEDANKLGWFVVDLEDIEAGTLEDGDPLLEQSLAQLQPALAAEYNAQLSRAIRAEVGVERNDEAVEALRRQLMGEN